jgi:predicted O-methyltransferase YrrM
VSIVNPEIDAYLGDLARSEDAVVQEMERRAAERGFPIVGPQVGRLLHLLARAAGARRVLELGSGFGYSAYWFARAVGPEGSVVLTEGSEANADDAMRYLERAGLGDRVRVEVGDALEIAGRVEGPFDIVFNDIDKHQYPRVPAVAVRALRPGGLLISDNMLWYGKVVAQGPPDDSTRGVLDLTRALTESEEFETVVLPVRDGVSVSRYRPRSS